MSQTTPKANSRKPELAVGTRVRAHGLDAVVVAVRRPKRARRYLVAACPEGDTLPLRRDQLEVVG